MGRWMVNGIRILNGMLYAGVGFRILGRDAFGEWIRWKVAVVYWDGYIQTLKGLEDANANANDPVLVKIICNVAMWKAKVCYFEGIII